jgi:hypothetical protein
MFVKGRSHKGIRLLGYLFDGSEKNLDSAYFVDALPKLLGVLHARNCIHGCVGNKNLHASNRSDITPSYGIHMSHYRDDDECSVKPPCGRLHMEIVDLVTQ